MSKQGDAAPALNEVRAAVAAAVAMGLTKKSAILAKALPAIAAARREGFTHLQIHVSIRAGGLVLTAAYYSNCYAREMRKQSKKTKARHEPIIQPAATHASMADELRRVRNVGRKDYSKLIKRKSKS